MNFPQIFSTAQVQDPKQLKNFHIIKKNETSPAFQESSDEDAHRIRNIGKETHQRKPVPNKNQSMMTFQEQRENRTTATIDTITEKI